jgi:hypothetical protein
MARFRYTPHDAQRVIHAARDKRFRIVCCGRRFGKTRCIAAELLTRGLTEAPGNYAWIAPTYLIADRGIEAFRQIAPATAGGCSTHPRSSHTPAGSPRKVDSDLHALPAARGNRVARPLVRRGNGKDELTGLRPLRKQAAGKLRRTYAGDSAPSVFRRFVPGLYSMRRFDRRL